MKNLLYLLFVAISLSTSAQSFDDFYEHPIDVHVIKSSPGYVSMGFQFASGNPGKFKLNFEYTSLVVPDVAIIATLNTLTEKHPDKSPFTNTFGSLAIGLNVVSTEKLIVSAGANITDYQMNDDIAFAAFYTAGSYLRADYLINDVFMIRVRSYLSKAFKNGETVLNMGTSVKGLSPVFIRTGAEVHYKSRWLGGVELYSLANYPGVSESRFNIRIGYKAW